MIREVWASVREVNYESPGTVSYCVSVCLSCLHVHAYSRRFFLK